uniref:Uncharacterized protein n=1 Tax=Anguilla anguilla TaxID=7936 RepID=A0A0E9TGX8_ANGAN
MLWIWTALLMPLPRCDNYTSESLSISPETPK